MERDPIAAYPSIKDPYTKMLVHLESIFSSQDGMSMDPDKFTTFSENRDACTIGAVDGSSTIILKGANFLVGSYRSAAVVFEGHQLKEKYSTPAIPILLSSNNMNRLYGDIFADFVGEMPDMPMRDMELTLQGIRVIEEMRMVTRLVERMGEGGIILIDGSLRSTIKRLDAFMEEIFERAMAKDISIVGISKSSSLSFGNIPIVPFVQYEGERTVGNKMWSFTVMDELGDVFKGRTAQLFGKVNVVKFNPYSEFVFRTDVLAKDTETTCVLGKLSQYCKDPSYLGYPYPLARVHNEAAITKGESEDMNHGLKNSALKRGIKDHQWRYLFQDFHDILDRGL